MVRHPRATNHPIDLTVSPVSFPGGYCSFHLAIRTHHQMILCPFTWTTPNPRRRPRAGMLVHSSLSSYPTFTTPLYIPSAVSCYLLLAAFIRLRCVIDAHHRFIAEECDWGFTRFSELRKLFNVQEGHGRPTIEEDAADITVYVRVLEDPTGVLWHNFVK
jgi:hypothetical protein